jgi:MFS family permease
MSGMLQHTYGQFIVAILFGLGVGNLWPIIYGYAIDIDPNRASFIGMAVNIVAMFWIPVTQLMIAPIWTSVQNDGTFSFYIPVIIGLVSVIALGALTVYSSIYFKKFRKQNNIKLDSE